MLPEIVPFPSVGEGVLIAGLRRSVGIGPGGLEWREQGRLADLVRDFRGT